LGRQRKRVLGETQLAIAGPVNFYKNVDLALGEVNLRITQQDNLLNSMQDKRKPMLFESRTTKLNKLRKEDKGGI